MDKTNKTDTADATEVIAVEPGPPDAVGSEPGGADAGAAKAAGARPGAGAAAADNGRDAPGPTDYADEQATQATHATGADAPATETAARETSGQPTAAASPPLRDAVTDGAEPGTTEPGTTERGTAEHGTAEHASASLDDVFLAMVARFNDEPTDRTWPDAENVGGPRRSSALLSRSDLGTQPPPIENDDGSPVGEAADAAGNLRDARRGSDAYSDLVDLDDIDEIDELDTDDVDDDTDHGAGASVGAYHDEDHFEPPPAPPAPRMKPVTRLALSSIALGLAILFVPTFVGYRASSTQDVTGVLLILGGVGTLVAKMGERPPTDSDGPDDGAVI